MPRGVETEFVKMTPAAAEELLLQNHVNRRLRARLVTTYADDMREGLWRPTGEAIKVSRTGALLDGQHRLAAIVESGKTIELLVVSGLPDESQELMDQGAARTAADALTLHGYSNVTLAAGVARWLVLAGPPGEHMAVALKQKASTARILRAAQENTDVNEAATKYSLLRHHIPGSPTAICYSWLWLNRADPAACDEFCTAFIELNFHPLGDDPRKAGLRALQRLDREDEFLNGTRHKGIATVSILMRTWNFWRKGEDVQSIPVRRGDRIYPPVMPV